MNLRIILSILITKPVISIALQGGFTVQLSLCESKESQLSSFRIDSSCYGLFQDLRAVNTPPDSVRVLLLYFQIYTITPYFIIPIHVLERFVSTDGLQDKEAAQLSRVASRKPRRAVFNVPGSDERKIQKGMLYQNFHIGSKFGI
jgi:hypothetical protein